MGMPYATAETRSVYLDLSPECCPNRSSNTSCHHDSRSDPTSVCLCHSVSQQTFSAYHCHQV